MRNGKAEAPMQMHFCTMMETMRGAWWLPEDKRQIDMEKKGEHR